MMQAAVRLGHAHPEPLRVGLGQDRDVVGDLSTPVRAGVAVRIDDESVNLIPPRQHTGRSALLNVRHIGDHRPRNPHLTDRTEMNTNSASTAPGSPSNRCGRQSRDRTFGRYRPAEPCPSLNAVGVPDRLKAAADIALGVVFAAAVAFQAYQVADVWGVGYQLFGAAVGTSLCVLALVRRRNRLWTAVMGLTVIALAVLVTRLVHLPAEPGPATSLGSGGARRLRGQEAARDHGLRRRRRGAGRDRGQRPRQPRLGRTGAGRPGRARRLGDRARPPAPRRPPPRHRRAGTP